MKKFYVLLLVLLSYNASDLFAQPVSAYTNFQNRFVTWDDGIVRNIESMPPLHYGIGRVAVPYFDHSKSFKIYSHGGVQLINQGFTTDFFPTDNLVAYRNNMALFVWENGKTTKLSSYNSNYAVGDSIVLYFDNVESRYNAYYNGNIFEIESFLGGGNLLDRDTNNIFSGNNIADGQLPTAKVSDNIAAYVNYANRFKIFYHGEITELENYTVNNFDVGRNTVAYVDADRTFKVFNNGDTYELESFEPESYKAGDDLVAYVSNDGYFKIFCNGQASTVGYFKPDYKVGDHVVAFEDGSGYFKVFYQGKIYTIDANYPDKMKVGYNSMAYVNRSGVLRLFSDGKMYDVTSAGTAEWRLDYDVVQYRFGQNMYKIFYQGKTF